VFKSNPVVPQNIDAFLTALGFVKDVASRTSVIEALNDTLGMNLQEKTQQEIDAEKPAPPVIDPTQKPANSNAKPTATTGQKPQQPPKATQKADKPLLKLLSKSLSQLVRGKRLDQDQMISLVTQVQSLTKAERDQLREDMLWELDMPDNADQDLMDLLSATVESHTGVSLN
jgi:hypothetical protein